MNTDIGYFAKTQPMGECDLKKRIIMPRMKGYLAYRQRVRPDNYARKIADEINGNLKSQI